MKKFDDNPFAENSDDDDEFEMTFTPLNAPEPEQEDEPEPELAAAPGQSAPFDWQTQAPGAFAPAAVPPAPETPRRHGLYDYAGDAPQGGTTREVPVPPAAQPGAAAAQSETQRFDMPRQGAQPSASAPAAAPAPAAVRPVAPVHPSNGKTVLISGGDRGIGAAAARAFWRDGYNTAVLYHTNEAAARALVNGLGSDCMAVRCDVADAASCAAAMAVVEKTFGGVDVLVSNAGIAQQKLFTDITPQDWQRMLGVNLTGAFNLCQCVLPGMIRRKTGRILTVSSMWGQTGGSCEVHYSAAKAGLIGLTKALAKEEGPSGITVNCVAPGVIETDMMASFSAEDKAALAEETPVGRLGTADEVAALLLYLAGDAAGYITGQVFGVNGGLVI